MMRHAGQTVHEVTVWCLKKLSDNQVEVKPRVKPARY